MKLRQSVKLAGFGLVLVGAGCAPRHFVDGVSWTVERQGVRDASLRSVDGWPCLRVNAFLLDRLEHVAAAEDLDHARDEFRSFLAEARQHARVAADDELDRLSSKALTRLWRRYFAEEPQPAAMRQAVRDRFHEGTRRRFSALVRRVDAAEDLPQLRALSRSILRSIGPSPKDHHGGGWLLTMIASSTEEPDGPLDHGGPIVDLYEPEASGIIAFLAGHNSKKEAALLARYAPTLVQERLADARYATDTDYVGTVRLTGSSERCAVLIDTNEPSVYAYWQYTWIQGRRHLQLTYTHWFPRHPKLKSFDAEQGEIEGATLRITLDANDRPAILETVLNCGCYHRCYPSDSVERAACLAHGGPAPGKRFCVERPMADRMDWVVPETVTVGAASYGGPLLFSRAGYHGLAGVGFDRSELAERTIGEIRPYCLRDYHELEHLPIGDGFGSMFDAKGLVRGAERLEGTMLSLTGMLNAGQPRQRGTQLLHWDDYDFDDPHLLEESLRLAPDFHGL